MGALDHPGQFHRVPYQQLTPRQREVWALMAQGWSNPTIALTMVLGLKSVENYINAIYTALGIVDPSYHKRVKAVLLYQQIPTPEEARMAVEEAQKTVLLAAQAATLAEIERAEGLRLKYLLALLAESLLFFRLCPAPAGLAEQQESLMSRIADALRVARIKPRNN